MKLALLAFLAAFALATAEAQTPKIKSVEITEYGIYTADTTGQESAPGTIEGNVSLRANEKLAVKTDTVPGQIGVHFGYRYRVTGTPVGANVNLHMVTIYPAAMRNPETGETRARSEYDSERPTGDESYRDYSFDSPWEIIPGVWTFEIWDGPRRLSSIKFRVVPGATS